MDSAKTRLTTSVQDSESTQSLSSAQIAALQRTLAETRAALTAADTEKATQKARADALALSEAKAKADAARAQTSLNAAEKARADIQERWKTAETRGAEAEASNMSLRAQLTEAQTATQIERSKSESISSIGAAHGTVSGVVGSPTLTKGGRFDEDLSSFATRETAAVADAKRAVRALEAERELAADILASLIPLPAFVAERAAESEHSLLSAGTSRSAAAKAAALAFSSSVELAEGELHRAAGADAHAGTAVSAALAPSPLITQLKKLAAERPVTIDALTFMDLELRKLRVERERLTATLESLKTTENATESSLTGVRRQLAAARTEIAIAADSRDAALERAARAEADAKVRANELAGATDSLRDSVRLREELGAKLEASRDTLAAAAAELDALKARADAVRLDFEAQIGLERASRDALESMMRAAAADAAAAHASTVAALQSRVAALEGDVDGARHEATLSSTRLTSASTELERARAELVSASGRALQFELALGQAEAAGRATADALRESEAARGRALRDFEDAAADRDAAAARLGALSSDLALVKARVSELETLEAIHLEDEVRLASLQARASDLEGALAQSQAETEQAERRTEQLRDQARVDLELAQSCTARVSHELVRLCNVREEDAAQANAVGDAARRSIAQLQTECEASAAEAAALRERCRGLQSQAAQLAAELQESRDTTRRFHEEAIQARSDRQVSWGAGRARALRPLTSFQCGTRSDFGMIDKHYPPFARSGAEASLARACAPRPCHCARAL
jgi:hypothetical protein